MSPKDDESRMNFAINQHEMPRRSDSDALSSANSTPWNCSIARTMGILIAIAGFAVLAIYRDIATGGPHHDEVIALMAAKGMEREWVRMSAANESPLHVVVPASKWHQYTRRFQPVPFSEIRADVMSWDKHPPLAFWVMNRWLSLSPEAGYRHAVALIWLELLITAGLLGFTAFRCSGSPSTGITAFAVFLAGNSTIFTATWVRQYGLFMFFFATLVLAAAEITRIGISRSQCSGWLAVIGAATLLGMMCQYTFSTMTGPIHLAVVAVLISRRQWIATTAILMTYAIAGALFFQLLPGVLHHASAVSAGLERNWQLLPAFTGLPRMYIPIPSNVPVIALTIAGTAAIVGPLLIAGVLVLRRRRESPSIGLADVRVPLAGMLGAGILQFALVTMGFFPGWATGENHMCPFWLLTVLSTSVLIANWSAKGRALVVVPVLTVLVGMQSLFIWHTHRIVPRINTSYIASQQADLVCVDNLARGFVLQVTDLMPAEALILATESARLAKQLTEGHLPDRVLYLPMDTTVTEGKPTVIAAARQAGYHVEELPVVHSGMYEAVLFTRRQP